MSIATSIGMNAASPPTMCRQEAHRLLLGLGLATAMQFYTYGSVNLILPDMAGALGLSRDEAGWILTVYSSALFFGVPFSTYLARRLGVLRYLIASVVAFCVASVGCAATHRLDTMLIWRVVQGLAGAGLSVWWRASVYMLMPKAERGRSLMRVSVMLYLSTAVGLVVSGWLTDNLDWRLIFLPNLLCGAVAIWLLSQHFPTVEIERHFIGTRLDGLGIALLGAALIAVQVILSRGEIDDWLGSPMPQALAWIAGLSLALFVWWQFDHRNQAPLLRVGLIQERNVLASATIDVFTGIILSGSIYAVPEYLREVFPNPLSATQTGQVMRVYALTAATIRLLVTWSIGKIGQRKAIIFTFELTDFELPPTVPSTNPSRIVRDRPDIRAAEARLHAASAAIGVATADLYPRLNLSASVAEQGLFGGPAGPAWLVLGGLTAPLFHGGALKAGQRAAEDDYQASQATYQQIVISALGQVADLLHGLQHDTDTYQANDRALESAGSALALARSGYRAGAIGVVQLLAAAGRLTQLAELVAVSTVGRRYTDTVKLFLAVGPSQRALEKASGTAASLPGA